MENNFINTKRSLTNDDLKQFESKFNIVMPDKIKKHYLKYNGGYPEKYVTFLSKDIDTFLESLIPDDDE